MDLVEFVRGVAGFPSWSHAEKIRFLGWYIHTRRDQEHFTPADIRDCYCVLHLDPPAKFGSFFDAMTKRTPKEALRSNVGYRLERRVRDVYDWADIHDGKIMPHL